MFFPQFPHDPSPFSDVAVRHFRHPSIFSSFFEAWPMLDLVMIHSFFNMLKWKSFYHNFFSFGPSYRIEYFFWFLYGFSSWTFGGSSLMDLHRDWRALHSLNLSKILAHRLALRTYPRKQSVDSEKQMDHLAAAEEQIASQRLKQKLNEVNVAAQTHLSPVQDHVNFTLQKAYFKCAYECFDRSRRQEEITNCVENCSIPLSNAQQKFDNEMAKFQEKLNRSLMVCQDRYESAKLQKKNGAMNDLVSCADHSIQESLKMLPLIAEKLKASLVIGDRAL